MARPKTYKTVKEMQEVIDRYFEQCQGRPLLDEEGNVLTDKRGNPVMIGVVPPTITGLALALGFSSRQTLLNYQGQKGFMDTITRAKSRCEAYTEQRLFDKDGARGAEFSLKYNYRWEDPQQERLRAEKTAAGNVTVTLEGEAADYGG